MSSRLRVLHSIGSFRVGGTETLLLNIYRHTDRNRIAFDALTWLAGEGRYEPDFKALGGRILRITPPRKSIVSFVSAIHDALRREKYAAIHCHCGATDGFVVQVARLAGIPVRIVHSHTTAGSLHQPPLKRLYRHFTTRLILANASALVATSEAARDALFGTTAALDQRSHIMPNGIDISKFENTSGHALRSHYGLPARAFMVGHVGRFDRSKNHPRILQIFKSIVAREPDAFLVLIGGGSLLSSVMNDAANLGLTERIAFLGERSDVAPLLTCLNAFLFPSLYEGFGLAVLEAQAAGVPCVASDRIPTGTDLGMGLLNRIPLEQDDEAWATAVLATKKAGNTEWTARRTALIRNGLDIASVAKQWSALYGVE